MTRVKVSQADLSAILTMLPKVFTSEKYLLRLTVAEALRGVA